LVTALGLVAQGSVRGQIDINPQNDLIDKFNDAIGLSSLFGDSDTPAKDRWYFWVIIALVIIFVIVCGYFTIRGCRRYRRVKKENQLRMLIPETKEVVYFDAETQEYIIEMSRRTGIPAEKIKGAAARHAVDGMGLDTVKIDKIVDEVSEGELFERYDSSNATDDQANDSVKVPDNQP